MKDLTLLVKLAELGVYTIYSYVAFILYTFFSNMGTIKQTNCVPECFTAKMFSWDIGNLAGTLALAFTIHNNVGPMIKCNKD
jgi:sodium-coupled neutral amino acid transporter 9